MPEEVRLRSVEVEFRIWMVGVFMPMTFFTTAPLISRRHEGTVRKEHRPRALRDLKSHDAIVGHTEPHGSSAEPVFDAVAHVLQKVPLLRLRSLILEALRLRSLAIVCVQAARMV